MSSEFREQLKSIRMLIMDVDGTLTDGKVYLGSNGEELKAFHVRDGYGIMQLCSQGIIPVFLSGRKSKTVERRADELGVREVYLGIGDKRSIFFHLKEKYGLSNQQIAYIGDDLNDSSILELAGVRISVNNCAESLKNICQYVTKLKGGEGAVREIIDLILEK